MLACSSGKFRAGCRGYCGSPPRRWGSPRGAKHTPHGGRWLWSDACGLHLLRPGRNRALGRGDAPHWVRFVAEFRGSGGVTQHREQSRAKHRAMCVQFATSAYPSRVVLLVLSGACIIVQDGQLSARLHPTLSSLPPTCWHSAQRMRFIQETNLHASSARFSSFRGMHLMGVGHVRMHVVHSASSDEVQTHQHACSVFFLDTTLQLALLCTQWRCMHLHALDSLWIGSPHESHIAP
jgi:hypothetical protein